MENSEFRVWNSEAKVNSEFGDQNSELVENAACETQNEELDLDNENENSAFRIPHSELETYSLTKEEFGAVQAHIQKLQADKDELTDMLQRNQAEFDNFRRRNAQVRLDSLEDGKRDCITALLPVLDDLDRVLENCEGVDSAWVTGIQLVQKKMLETLKKAGLAAVPEQGDFDPAVHMAVQTQKAEGLAPGQLVTVLQKGYTVGERVIRPGMVVVSE